MLPWPECTRGDQKPPPAPPPPPPDPPPPNPPPPPPEPDDAGEFPIVPSAAIIPPKLGIGEELMRPGAQPPDPPPDAAAGAAAAVPGREVAERRDARLDVVGRPLEDLLDLLLEPERDAPHDGLVGGLEQRDRRLCDDLPIDRACAIVFSSVRR